MKRIAALAFIALMATPSAMGHGGRLAADGCHNDRKAGTRHCHRAGSATQKSGKTKRNQMGTVARVIDGDTFVLEGGTKIRLCGVNSPELRHRGGREAKDFMTALIEGEKLSCRTVGAGTPCDGRSRSRSYDRTVAQCFLGDMDIAEKLVTSGHAEDSPRYSGGHYD